MGNKLLGCRQQMGKRSLAGQLLGRRATGQKSRRERQLVKRSVGKVVASKEGSSAGDSTNHDNEVIACYRQRLNPSLSLPVPNAACAKVAQYYISLLSGM